jgi:hypothetical protein
MHTKHWSENTLNVSETKEETDEDIKSISEKGETG